MYSDLKWLKLSDLALVAELIKMKASILLFVFEFLLVTELGVCCFVFNFGLVISTYEDSLFIAQTIL